MRHVLTFVALAVAILVAGFILIRARESATRHGPISGCFGGLLDQYPVHCAALEGLHNQGTIRIEAIYESGEALFLFVGQYGHISQGTYALIKDHARRELEAAGWDVCVSDLYQDFGCEFGVLQDSGGFRLLPPMAGWDDIILVTGGHAALRSQRAWASMRKRWPATAQGGSGTDSASAVWDGGEFDLSDVNVTDDLKAVDCRESRHSISCEFWERHPGLGIAGVFYFDNDPKTYFQIKAPTGANDPSISAARTEIVADRYGIAEADFIAIPANYDYADLWRWEQILERFVLSAGNTIGLSGAEVSDNTASPPDAVYPTSYVVEFRDDVPTLFRSTIAVVTRNPDLTVAALPQLLWQLGIPVEAVGIVVESDFKSYGIPRAHSHALLT